MAPKKRDENNSTQFWFPYEEEGYVLGEIVQQDPETEMAHVRLLTQDHEKTAMFHASVAKPVNPRLLDGVNDNTQLMHLHEPSLLFNLRYRYSKNLIYTYTGYILIAVNPYKALGCYGEKEMQSYRGKSIGVLPPHLYAMADRAYRSMKVDGSCQSIIISGESGSGKTESSKIVMKYLAMCGQPATSGDEERRASLQLNSLAEKVLKCNPLLEAFGNAKTVMNNNSSRFGKFTRIHFDKRNWLVGADIVTYLLEKSRTVTQSGDERNYHCFYQMFAGLSTEEKKQLELTCAEDCVYLKGGVTTVASIDDAERFSELTNAMSTIGISEHERQGVFSTLASLLHLGNVEFEATDEDSCKVVDPTPLRAVANFLKVPFSTFEEALLSRTMKSMSNSIYKIPLKMEEARYARDSLAKALYSKLFDWLVTQVNNSLLTDTETRAFIGVLDIFGFEDFAVNSFEQLCINFANEKLQAHFNTQVFRQEQEIYIREAIRWERIDEPNNQGCINMLSAKGTTPVGIFSLLDEQCRLPKCTHKTFTEKVFSAHKEAFSHGLLLPVPRGSGLLQNEGFVVTHYAGKVLYRTQGFLQKNNGSLHDDLELVLQTAEDEFLSQVMQAAAAAMKTSATGARGGAGARNAKSRFNSVSAHFTTQLGELTSTLQATSSHFVRCINPNTKKTPDSFTGGHVLHQLRCSGMMEALRLMHAGFPTRCPYEDLYNRYKDMMPRSIASLDSPSFCEILLMALGLDKADYQLGITKVFFRAGKLAFLDQLTGSEYKELAPDIANKVKKWLIKKRWRRHTIAVVAFLRMKRTLADLRLVRQLVSTARFLVLMANRPMLSVKRAREIRRRNGATMVQKYYRRTLAMAKMHRTHWATWFVQRLWRGHTVRKSYGGRLAEIRARRRAEEEAKAQAREEEKKAKEREEIERIKEMARNGVVAAPSGKKAAQYSSKSRPAKAAAVNDGAAAGGQGGTVVSEDVLARLEKLEGEMAELSQLREKVRALEEKLAATEKLVEDNTRKGGTTAIESSKPMRSRSQSIAVAQPQAVRSRRQSQSGNAEAKRWGLLDLLGISSQQQPPPPQPVAPPMPLQQAPANCQVTPASVASSVSKRSANAQRSQGSINAIPPASDAFIVLQGAIKSIEKHFGQAEIPGNTKSLEILGDDQKDKDIAVLVRGQLCTALSRVLLHGFKSFKLIGRYHIWDFVQESCDAAHKRLKQGNKKYDKAESSLTAAVVEVNSHEGMANNPNIKFRSFVCSGLNNGLLHEWVNVLMVDKDTMTKFYENWAFVNSSADALKQMVDALRPLGGFKYTLSLDYELTKWDLH